MRHRTRQGIDPAAKLLAQAPADILAEVRVGVAERLPYGSQSFDMVLCLAAAQNFSDMQQAFCEIARVLVPSGYLLLSIPRRSPRLATVLKTVQRGFNISDRWQGTDVMLLCSRR
jgi:ubiquinone/menaquinone biosynthesis C-methylase UbiE